MTAASDLGLAFPAAADGSRSSTAAGTAMLAAALRPLDEAAARAAETERHWRRHYPQHFRALVRGGLGDARRALQSAQAGLAMAREQLVFETATGAQPLRAALAAPQGAPLRTNTLQGRGEARPAP